MTKLQELGLRGNLYSPTDNDTWTTISKRLVKGHQKSPRHIFQPVDTEDVARAVRWAVSAGVPLAVRCGGNTAESSVDDGLIIDLRKMNSVRLDGDVAYCGGGCLWDDVYVHLHKHGRLTAGGGAAVVGIGGFCLGGGHSWLSSKYGAGVDQIVSATVVIADGSVVKCDAETEPDLFWAIRGGSSQFGVVTELALKTYPELGEMFVGAAIYADRVFDKFMPRLYDWLANRRPADTLVLGLIQGPPGMKESLLLLNPFAVASEEEGLEIFSTFLDADDMPPLMDATFSAPSMVEVSHAADAVLLKPGPPLSYTAVCYFTQLWRGMVEQIRSEFHAFLEANTNTGIAKCLLLFECHQVTRPNPTATSFHSPDVPYGYMAAAVSCDTESELSAIRTFSHRLTAIVRQYEKKGSGKDYKLIANCSPGYVSAEDVWGENYPRLRKLKARFDPKGVFNLFHSIEPDFS